MIACNKSWAAWFSIIRVFKDSTFETRDKIYSTVSIWTIHSFMQNRSNINSSSFHLFWSTIQQINSYSVYIL